MKQSNGLPFSRVHLLHSSQQRNAEGGGAEVELLRAEDRVRRRNLEKGRSLGTVRFVKDQAAWVCWDGIPGHGRMEMVDLELVSRPRWG